MAKQILSFVIPARNEEKFLSTLLEQVINVKLPNDLAKEIIVINDGSTDSTPQIIEEFAKKYNYIKAIHNNPNVGKSQAVKKGILNTKGEYVVIQDADLEYVPSEIAEMMDLMLKQDLDVVYGNRFGKRNKVIYWQNYFGNKTLSLISNLFTYPRIGVYLPDMEVCYKLVKGEILRDLAQNITAKSNFGFEPEITAKLSRYKSNGKRLKFAVHPISYVPRSVAEGKKMKAVRDGLKALKEIITYNVF